MRIFIALDIDDAIRHSLQRFTDAMRGFAPDARWVRVEGLHVTLKFVGEKPAAAVEEMSKALTSLTSPPVPLHFRGTGFFPTPRSARVFWAGVDGGPELVQLAVRVDEVVSGLGVPREEHAFSPHLTLARAGSKSGAPHRQPGDRPTRVFGRLQEKLAAMSIAEFGTMTAREFYLYESKLAPGGAQYKKIEVYPLSE